jgi:hypothetical protein
VAWKIRAGTMSKHMTPKQREIRNFAFKNGGITKAQAVELLKGDYYCNAAFHVGNVLSRMVNAGILVRVKRGVFEVAKPEYITIINEPNLFTI